MVEKTMVPESPDTVAPVIRSLIIGHSMVRVKKLMMKPNFKKTTE